MKYFRRGNFLYGIIYFIWRGFNSLSNLFSTWLYISMLPEAGKDIRIKRGFYVAFPRNVVLGSRVSIGNNVRFTSENETGKIFIDDSVQINDGVIIDFTGDVRIRRNVLISANTRIITHDHGYDPHSVPQAKSLIICESAWIGLNALILPSVRRIGKYSVIGAGAVVTKDVPEYAVVAGNPAKIIKFRNDLSGQAA